MAQQHPEQVQRGDPRLRRQDHQQNVQHRARGTGEKLAWLAEQREKQAWQVPAQHTPRDDGEDRDLGD